MSVSPFVSLGVPEDLVEVLARRGIHTPFPIQTATLPDVLAGRDVSGRAPTGSGKTLAFGLAVVEKGPRATSRKPGSLILTPTRELAAQIARELQPLAAARNRTIATVYGGTGYEAQRKALRRGCDILVACPGRLEDLIAQRDVALDGVGVVVVDEADRMADMGFLPAVRRLLDATRKDRQTMLFSATLDGDVDVLVRRYQRDPRRYEVALPEEQQGDVRHLFWQVERSDRVRVTAGLLGRHDSAIVFCRTRHGAERLTKQLARAGVDAAAIHGSRTQPQRDRALHAFSTGKVRALVATDVAARGIHVDDVACVIHYDAPATDKDYVHRSGRTGRAGAEGTVVTLVMGEQGADVRAIQKALRLPLHFDAPDADLGVPHLHRAPSNGHRAPSPNGRSRSRNRQHLRRR